MKTRICAKSYRKETSKNKFVINLQSQAGQACTIHMHIFRHVCNFNLIQFMLAPSFVRHMSKAKSKREGGRVAAKRQIPQRSRKSPSTRPAEPSAQCASSDGEFIVRDVGDQLNAQYPVSDNWCSWGPAL